MLRKEGKLTNCQYSHLPASGQQTNMISPSQSSHAVPVVMARIMSYTMSQNKPFLLSLSIFVTGMRKVTG